MDGQSGQEVRQEKSVPFPVREQVSRKALSGNRTIDLFGHRSFLHPCRHSCVGRNPAHNACRLDSRFRGKDAFGVSEQVSYKNRQM